MKKLQTIIVAITLVVLAIACHRGRHTVIQTSDGNHITRIEYQGKLVFNQDTSIGYMSPRGYLKYKHNDETLDVDCDASGRISYAVNDEKSVTILNTDGKQLLAEAVKEIEKSKGKPKNN